MVPDLIPDVVLRAASRFGLEPAHLKALPGASRQTWRVGDYVLRVRPRLALRTELAAVAAAQKALPVPRVLATAELGEVSAALLEMLPGRPAGRLDGLTTAEAYARGGECARVHGVLARVSAPDLLPEAHRGQPAGKTGSTVEGSLLHLDLHPFNLLVDDAGRLSGVLDWANAASGDPDLDRARTVSILTLDPAALKRRADPRWIALTQAWIDSGDLIRVPRAALAWAYQYMLGDLAQRYPEGQLAHVRAALAHTTR